ncbi:MAG TPA: XdhC/CoxI family protein [Bryobacteraceae bacterium]|jgi:xanthine/CO dehydrogenase XdhC/CoxF family maturation factor|nr:XdhC/CoxI family protein [Bryobacteraceae bacterium]
MRERNQILALWHELAARGDSAVLATVIRTEGSSYRLPGARLLIARDGRHAGAVSGGCLETELIQKAFWFTENGPVVRKYDTEGDYGLGCNGIIHVLLERVTPDAPGILPLLETVQRERRPVAIANGDFFAETLVPPIHLLIFGAGDDAVPLADLAKYLGWQVSIFDGRSQNARRERFPSADRVAVRPPGSPAPPVDPWTAAVVMTHSYAQDLDILRALSRLDTPLPYLGILGPRKRTEQLLAEAEFPRDGDSDPHSPLGLDLGGHGAEQVAIAAIAEIQAVFNHRSGGFLRDRQAPIHSQTNA